MNCIFTQKTIQREKNRPTCAMTQMKHEPQKHCWRKAARIRKVNTVWIHLYTDREMAKPIFVEWNQKSDCFCFHEGQVVDKTQQPKAITDKLIVLQNQVSSLASTGESNLGELWRVRLMRGSRGFVFLFFLSLRLLIPLQGGLELEIPIWTYDSRRGRNGRKRGRKKVINIHILQLKKLRLNDSTLVKKLGSEFYLADLRKRKHQSTSEWLV